MNRINAEIESSTERLMASAFKDSADAEFVEVEEINPEEGEE